MRMVVLVLLLNLAVAGAVLGSNPTLSAGGAGPPTRYDSGSSRDALWSEPPDLNGLIASSEIIGDFGLESEIANDFVLATDANIGLAIWWGGYLNGNGCGDVGFGTNWNIRFYDDGGCVPGGVIYEQLDYDANETLIGCQAGLYPMFEYYTSGFAIPVVGGNLYWFGCNTASHTFPPQVGRLASMSVVNCTSVFKGAFFAFPDWVSALDVFGVAVDFSQEFDNLIVPPPDSGACCVGDQGECRMALDGSVCDELGGVWQGYDTDCNPNPCDATPVQETTWGRIKAQFR